MTPYAIAIQINAALTEQGRGDLVIRTQMMYNYAKNGMIVKGQKGRKEYTQVEADAFVEKFVANRIAKSGGIVRPTAPSSFSVEDIKAIQDEPKMDALTGYDA